MSFSHFRLPGVYLYGFKLITVPNSRVVFFLLKLEEPFGFHVCRPPARLNAPFFQGVKLTHAARSLYHLLKVSTVPANHPNQRLGRMAQDPQPGG